MADFVLGRLKFVYKGNWTTSTALTTDDIVKYGGNAFVVKQNHTSGTFATDLAANKLEQITGGTDFKGAWASATAYKVDDLVVYGGQVFACNTDHTSQTLLYDDESKWTQYTSGFKWRGVYAGSTHYKVNDVVKYGASTFVCTTQHTTTGSNAVATVDTLATTQGYDTSTTINNVAQTSSSGSGTGFIGNFTTDGNGQVTGITVVNGGSGYSASETITIAYASLTAGDGTSTTDFTFNVATITAESTLDNTKFAIFAEGLQFEDAWSNTTNYQIGDVVTYGGYAYVAKVASLASEPSTTNNDWGIITTGFSNKGDFNSSSDYEPGDLVNYGGHVYECKLATAGTNPPTDTTYWNKLLEGFSWKGTWTAGTVYYPGDAVQQGVSTYRAKITHTAYHTNSTDSNRPDLDGTLNAGANWSSVAIGDQNATNVLSARGDIMVNDATPQAVALSLGTSKSVLTSNGLDPIWALLGDYDNAITYFVAPHGSDATTSADTGRGKSKDKPWATIKYALDQIAADTANASNFKTLYVASGEYTEQLPMTVPANTAVIGDEMRSVRIKPDTTTDNGSGAGISSDGTTPNNRQRMWLLNNATTIRHCTFSGLTGQLKNSPDADTLTRPTDDTRAGASATATGVYCSLDPSGSITSQSPYVQNCTAISTGAVGIKIDGNAQSSGYKSILANDFTQIHSDGIGVWCIADGRSEIVSVFTYYCHVGYLADAGGTIRSLNGNCSYGEFGIVSAGIDGNETPYTGTVDNRNFEASIGKMLAGGAGNSSGGILRAEFLYAGEQYGKGAIKLTNTGTADSSRTQGIYYALTPTSTSGSGTGFKASITVDGAGGISSVQIIEKGTGFIVGEQLTFSDANLGGGGASNLVLTVTEVWKGFAKTVDSLATTTGYDATTSFSSITQTSTSGAGSGAEFNISTDGTGAVTSVQISKEGSGYVAGETITIAYANLTTGGGASTTDFTFNIATVSDGTFTVGGAGGNAKVNINAEDGGVKYVDVLTNGTTHHSVTGNAQEGNATQIKIAASDTISSSSSYQGMRITLFDGPGAGQTAKINTYDPSTKLATVQKEDGTSGWDLFGTRTVAETSLTTSTKYIIEPNISFSDPGGSGNRKAQGRAIVSGGFVTAIYIFDSGKGYSSAPTITITDGLATTLATATAHIGDGVLTATVTAAGTNYNESTTTGTVLGGGYRDELPVGNAFYAENLTQFVREGSSFRFSGDSTNTDYLVVEVKDYDSNLNTATILVNPQITKDKAPSHGATATFREKFSNVRVTGHDFLNVGTGDTTTTNYPGIPTQNPDQDDEVAELDRGRAFYTSTDQDGNFRVGNLFRVQQSTGKATLNADIFDLSGLQELSLGGITVGSNFSASINEFSVDGTLSGNSDQALVTERAIKTYVDSQLGSGDNQINVNQLRVGDIQLSGNDITNVSEDELGADLDLSAKTGYVINLNSPTRITEVPSNVYDVANKSYVDGLTTSALRALKVPTTGSDANRLSQSKIGFTNEPNQVTDATDFDTLMFFSGDTQFEIDTNGHLIFNIT